MKRMGWILLSIIVAMTIVGCNKNEKGMIEIMDSIEIYVLSEQQAKECFLDAYDEQLAKEKNLIENNIYETKYLTLNAAYKALLNYYLVEKTELNEYQEMLDTHIYEFPVLEQDSDMAYGSFGRSNISILSNVFIERLGVEDIQLLSDSVENNSLNITEELLEMVDRTYQEIITVKYEETDKVFEVFYSQGALKSEKALNNAIVIGIKYDPVYDDQGNIVSKTYEEEKYKTISTMVELIESEMKMELGVTVTVFLRN